MHGDTNGLALVGNGPRHGLPDPPDGVGAEAIAFGVVELLGRPHQANVALLHQVEEGESLVAVALGDGDDKAQVALDHTA